VHNIVLVKPEGKRLLGDIST